MKNSYGSFCDIPGGYKLTSIPECGNFEYLYKNEKIFLRVDQFGPSFAQYLPPAGLTILKRKEREIFSPWSVYIQIGKEVINIFDLYKAKKFEIVYTPEKCMYNLDFKNIKVITTITLSGVNAEILMTVQIINKTEKIQKIKVLENAVLEMTDSTMMAWDKREWYQNTKFDGELTNPSFIVKHLSVNGNKDDRKKALVLFDDACHSAETSYEKLVSSTLNFNKIPDELSIKEINEIYAIEQTCAVAKTVTLNKEITLSSAINIFDDEQIIDKKEIISHLGIKYFEEQINIHKNNFAKIKSVQNIITPDNNLNKFINEFLPQEIDWVIDLDRGWATGMRGTRDCANDFMGLIPYNPKKCRDLIIHLLSSQRKNDGWFPRQIPFGKTNKYDLREFVDSGAFVIELIFEYISFTDDFSIFEELIPYYQENEKEKGVLHLIRAAKFYTLEENIGEHGLIKLKGGDWLDCLNRVGLKGRAETLMVTCQAVLAFRQVNELLEHYENEYAEEIKLFNSYTKIFKNNINRHCYVEEGFYKSIFSDDGKWYFSANDIDGVKRVYVPSNAYAIIAGINPKKDKKIIKSIINNNRTSRGYRLFSKAFGDPAFEGLGKMSSGDFPINALENGAIYNHGSQLFLIRALSKIGDYKTIYDVINFAMPYNQKFHPEKETCLPMYAITNVYQLIPSYEGRAGMCFLTGSISMIARAIYHWIFGINYHPSYLELSPCIPKEYKDSEISYVNNGINIKIKYHGFGSSINKILLNNIEINGKTIDKNQLKKNTYIEVFLK